MATNMPRLTYGDFGRTGSQDCSNAIDFTDFDVLPGEDAARAVNRTWATWETDDDLEARWIGQQDDFEGLDPHRAYEAWRDGWKGCAISLLSERYRGARDNPAKKPGVPFQVDVKRLFASGPKIDDTIVDVAEGRLSYSSAMPLVVSALDTPRGGYYIIDGHHRAVEAAIGGSSTVRAILDKNIPRIERTGGAHQDLLTTRVNVYDRVKQSARRNPSASLAEIESALKRSSAIRGWSGNLARMAIKSGEMSNPKEGKYRVTFFGPDGPHGHVTRNTDRELAQEIRTVMGGPILPMTDEEVIEWTSTDEFEKGSKLTAYVQAENALRWRASKAGRLEWAAGIISRANDIGTKRGTVNVHGKPYDSGAIDDAIAMISTALRQLPDSANPPPRSVLGRPVPRRDQPCYRTKAEMIRKFIDVNADIVQGYGGADYAVSPSEFDAVNHKYGLSGKKAVRTIADAVWVAMPVGKPYCLDRLDLDALNDTSPAKEAGMPFRLPDIVYESALAKQYARHYADLPEPAWVTEMEDIEAAPIVHPSEFLPYHLELEEQEPGMSRYRMGELPQVVRRHAPIALPPPTPTTAPEPEPYRLTLEEEEPGMARYRINPSRPVENPAWVTSILSKHLVELEESIPAKWLPKLTRPTASRGRISAALKEYGCGAYGCVLPTMDPKVVLKLTTDDTEAQFAHELADTLAAPVVVKYHLTLALPERHKGRPSYLLWRDAAERVGELGAVVSERGGDGDAAEDAIDAQHAAARKAFEALERDRPAAALLKNWEQKAREMGKVPELRELADGMITNVRKNGIFMGDVHGGNIGRVDGRWVIIDPGHVAVLDGVS